MPTDIESKTGARTKPLSFFSWHVTLTIVFDPEQNIYLCLDLFFPHHFQKNFYIAYVPVYIPSSLLKGEQVVFGWCRGEGKREGGLGSRAQP